MSRLIVKNLPNKVTVDKLKELFQQKGEVTDVQLKYTKDGKFRNFGFVGFRTEEQAAAAREHFDETFINSMKITVQECANLGDEKKPRAWSKYASDSTAYKKIHKDETVVKTTVKKKLSRAERNKIKIKELLKKHKDDPLFAEFIEAHTNEQTMWIKEIFTEVNKSDDDSGVEEENEDLKDITKETKSNDMEIPTAKAIESELKTADAQISDLEYMKVLMKKVDGFKEEAENITTPSEPKKIRNRPLFHVKINGLPFKCKKKDVKAFLKPLVPYSIRLPLSKGKKLAGFCYVGFRTEKELKKALSKDKLFFGTHRIHINKYEDKTKKSEEEEQLSVQKRQEKVYNGESIGESGSIFVRNLPYVLSEDELTKLFEKYGPLADVNMPIDPVLRQPKGFATITFVIPEHAVKAYTELDGTAFCGRMLHLLPAKIENTEKEDDGDLTFKEKKAKKLKDQAKSSHNWNTLFLGANAVADVVAANYNTTKEQLLTDNNKNTSAAVRLALGETQLVAETRTFLETNGVYLDAFNRPSKKRSKTCILVKNLPSGTDKDEVKTLFEKHGQIARFLMPKHGITALVDFIEPFEAKRAFMKLAYSQFKSAPLYLEWAPEDVFIKTTHAKPVEQKSASVKSVKDEEIKLSESVVVEENDITETNEDVEEPENNTTLFIKNLNFKTTEDMLRKHFSNCGKIHNITIAKKKDPRNPGQFLSMGYGFVQFYKKQQATEALKTLQGSTLDGKALELKRSERGNTTDVAVVKKGVKETKQNGTKILVRNVPFQANRNELHEIFRAFGEIKTLRLPKKLTPGADQHRGFAFVDFYSKADAKTAFEALCLSTHIYGRRLVLEWADQSEENEDVTALRRKTAQDFNAKTPGGKKSKKAAIDVDEFVDNEN
ncbi:probable RNA-binding protein 19 [Leptidea sinapis]|uniref:probable RNA-binding protein 19 n=1 Tax=Leptidea sinapis TaxID=189913 RepID=UPI0021455681|nr:probable RNA-binding protein 19 [Leptidea sinapis]